MTTDRRIDFRKIPSGLRNSIIAFGIWWLLAPEAPHIGEGRWGRVVIYSSLLVGFALIAAVVTFWLRLVASSSRKKISQKRIFVAVFLLIPLVIATHFVGSYVIAAFIKITFALSVGLLLALAVERLWWIPVCSFAFSLADMWSVFSSQGVTKNIVENHEKVLGFATVILPALGRSIYETGAIGIVDIVIMSWFIAVALLWKLPIKRLFVAIVIGCMCAFAFAIEFAKPIPATPFIALAALLVHANYYWDSAIGSRRATNSE